MTRNRKNHKFKLAEISRERFSNNAWHFKPFDSLSGVGDDKSQAPGTSVPLLLLFCSVLR